MRRKPRVRAVAVALAGVALVSSAPARAAATIDEQEFASRLAQARSEADAAIANPSRAALDRIVATLGLPVDVVVPAGTISIPRDRFLLRVRADTADGMRAALARVEIISDAFDRARRAPASDREAIDAALRVAYRDVRAQPNILTRARERLAELLRWALEGVASAVSHGVGTVIALVLGAIVVAFAVFLILRRTKVVRERSVRAEHRDPAIADPARALADALARGDTEAAVRAQYQLLIMQLADRGAIPDEPSLTAGECRRAVAGSLRPAYPVVESATRRYERVVYGRAGAQRDDVDELQRATVAVKNA